MKACMLYEKFTMKDMKSMKKGVFGLLSGCLIRQGHRCSIDSSFMFSLMAASNL